MKNIQVRVEDDLKNRADKIFGEIGTTTNDAIKMFLKASLRENGFPFELQLPQPTTIDSYVSSHMLSISDNDFREALDYLTFTGDFYKNDEFEKVFMEQVKINGFVGDKEVTLAEARVFMVDTTMNDFVDVADSESGDLELVASAMVDKFDLEMTQVAIIDEFFVFAPTVTAEDRVKLVQKVYEYLKSRNVRFVGFCNAGLWRTNSIDEQRALTKSIKKMGSTQIYVSKNWSENVFGDKID
ncbi:type II toxin-antitoxin system RelB/DinJ family antitoxin [Levilactobacillus zymae]|uniref:type II toxin-antitoxin system RelB/DinJ family antitoxin n=1 Tax=Levilactobacillus zymae TaxID=267363 RepID=UPI0028BA79E4|nr:type II toxin-antitoxin system RelB/DinJ family antitoxin [Levilactobacillus zymae]MDT6979395.1 type II toxin-antitoxin system RelB/DinJ family antitoxin [Levilactobacillus zymae]